MLQRRLAPMLLLASLPPLATAPWAWANDSTAMLEAGGIRLVETRSISLDKEELYISPTDIRIHYEFFNHSRTGPANAGGLFPSRKSRQNRNIITAYPIPIR